MGNFLEGRPVQWAALLLCAAHLVRSPPVGLAPPLHGGRAIVNYRVCSNSGSKVLGIVESSDKR